MADAQSIKYVQNTFSIYGFNITRDIASFVLRQLGNMSSKDREMWLIKITDQLASLNLQNPHVTLDVIKRVFKECLRPQSALQETETIFNVINTFEIPKVVYDIEKKKFVLEKVPCDLYPDAIYKPGIFRHRLEMLKHITLRQEAFTTKSFGPSDDEKYELTPIEFLLSNSKSDEIYVMGVLSQLTEGKFYLEDTGGAVKLDLKNTTFEAGLITEGSIVIVQGIFNDGILKVQTLGLPPAEASGKSRIFFRDENTFGGPHKTSLKQSEKLKAHERSHNQDMMIFLSDVWLDNVDVLSKLRVIMDGYSDDPPIAFIFCGHFLSFPPNVSSAQKLKEGFNELAKIISNYPDILQFSKFVFVPGPHDLGSPKILPRGPLPKTLLQDFLKAVPNTIFASNPCRIQYCTKEIVVIREDVLTKLCRNTLQYPETGHVWDHYARSIICQSHLAPMSLPVAPVYWKHDHVLQLFPTPDLIVAADQFQAYTTSYNNCHVVNPGSFRKSSFLFKAYKPAINEIEDCEVPEFDDV